MTALLGMAALGATAFAAPSIAANENSDFKNKYESGTQTVACGDDGDTVTYAGPERLWPPNHKLQPVSITATEGDDADPTDEVTITVVPDVIDATGGDGGPQHDPDHTGELSDEGTGSATADFNLRSERSGKGEGRTYDLDWVATFDNTLDECTGTFTVVVPHDMRGGADWK